MATLTANWPDNPHEKYILVKEDSELVIYHISQDDTGIFADRRLVIDRLNALEKTLLDDAKNNEYKNFLDDSFTIERMLPLDYPIEKVYEKGKQLMDILSEINASFLQVLNLKSQVRISVLGYIREEISDNELWFYNAGVIVRNFFCNDQKKKMTKQDRLYNLVPFSEAKDISALRKSFESSISDGNIIYLDNHAFMNETRGFGYLVKIDLAKTQ